MITKYLKKIYTRVVSAIFKAESHFINKKLIYFESFHGKQFNDNPRALYEYLKETSDYKLIWGVKKGHEQIFIENDVPYVRRFSLKWLLVMPRASYWIINTRIPAWFYKSSKIKYLQTWHGTPLKKIGLDIQDVHMPNTNTQQYRKNIVLESERWDYLISPNQYSTKIFNQAFKVDKSKIIETGYPRNDKLVNKQYNESYINEIKKQLNIPKNKKVIMYAPTWRDDEYITKGSYKFNVSFDVDKLRQVIGDEFVLLLRMHYLVTTRVDENDNFLKDVSDYTDVSDLYLISDILITDYSSVMFDYGILKRPQIFYAYDLENYDQNLRGFYLDYYKELPGPIAKNENELLDLLKESGSLKERYNEEIERFYNEYCYTENGKATQDVIKTIISNS
ncbi:CDP-glycerol glycerophosphotransferase family protein [Staphylococcus simiae]|uniref:teichoic acid glycerol-phosphate transferase TarF n=1 Tax=Staphylococcus simiae TaxID=308354 RepID=UPI001A96CF92|nr:teichoic acid glycerol-phosphate transferase TarF [Staphylococcus simiae]MBO1199407.1 CDP-glycerol glycerophosphotransferase family protein [Staphylococcus simiae]MBO1201857.1 CDP-glycerol glycerophosphotransferase family protein [Staphylococcus simiae]MBO1204071.1 CDP-glycerol glycerophosphotransferase family protein [Staphylococcus simiae]MBO1211119.1 CDP-glycerol glycerophosphotransferase family protein [Staphylococcus simiae]MBO1230315.1 CDP-glycerol glycerophosphotransferase family pro